MTTSEIKLSHPVEVDGVEYSSLSLREPTDDDLALVRRMNAGRYLRGVKLTALLAGLSPRTLEKITADDSAATNAIAQFFRHHIP